MTRKTTRRRVLALALGLIGPALAAPPASAQTRITWTVDMPHQVKEIWSMRPDGSDKVSHFPAGVPLPADYTDFGPIVGPSAGAYPLDPAVPGSPPVRWFLTLLISEDRADLFAFAPGPGGVAWRQLTDWPFEPEPGLRERLIAGLSLPTSPDDSFVALTIRRTRFQGPTPADDPNRIHTVELVRLGRPFERAAFSVGVEDCETVIAERPVAQSIEMPSFSPDGRLVAYRGPVFYPDGTSRGTLRLHDAATGADAALFDPRQVGFAAAHPRWSPDGREIAFARAPSTSSDAAAGVYAVNPQTGAVRALVLKEKTAYHYDQPVWSPDGTALVGVQHYSGSNSNLTNRYAIGRFPASGVTKKAPLVLLTPTSQAYRRHTILGWR